jgi:hypothetical protein
MRSGDTQVSRSVSKGAQCYMSLTLCHGICALCVRARAGEDQYVSIRTFDARAECIAALHAEQCVCCVWSVCACGVRVGGVLCSVSYGIALTTNLCVGTLCGQLT